MRWQTHIAAGLAAAGVVCHVTDPTSIRCCVLIAGSSFGALLPDIDCSESKIATSTATTSCISVLLEDGLGHRGLIHTPIALLIVSALFSFWYNAHLLDGWGIGIQLLGCGVLIGYVSHLLLDMFTPYGIMLLYPFSKSRFTIKSLLYEAKGESHLFSILFLLDVLLYIVL